MDRFSDVFVDWERGALKELYNEYSSILIARRIHLRPAALTLADSQSHWGSWIPETRTIELSRKLLLEQPWFHVLGILRHEMAHQLVDEESGDHSHRRPHGELFQRACERIGVPSEYRGATAHLRAHDLDWRSQKNDEIAERMLERVRKLLALATSANEHEAALAMNRVREIYAKYNLERAERSDFVHLVISSGSKRIEAHERRVVSILVGHFFVQVITGHTYHAPTGETHRMIELVGRRENVLMAEYVYHFLLRQSDALVDQMVDGGRKLDRVARKSYRLGILQGFAEKLKAAERPTAWEKENDSNPISKALVAFNEDRELEDYLGEIYPRLRNIRSSSQRIDSRAYAAGKAAGGRITLNKPVTGGARGFGGFLSGK